MPEEEEFKAARRVQPSDITVSLPEKLAAMAIPGGAIGIAIGLICLLNENRNSLILAGAFVFGCGVIADAIRSNSAKPE